MGPERLTKRYLGGSDVGGGSTGLESRFHTILNSSWVLAGLRASITS